MSKTQSPPFCVTVSISNAYPAEYHHEAIDRLTDRLKWLPTKCDVVEVLDEVSYHKSDPVTVYLRARAIHGYQPM